MPHPRRKLFGCVAFFCIAIAGLAYLGFWLVTRRWHHDVGTYTFAPDIQIRLFIESDIDLYPSLFYEIF